jgi:hypothetical protein
VRYERAIATAPSSIVFAASASRQYERMLRVAAEQLLVGRHPSVGGYRASLHRHPESADICKQGPSQTDEGSDMAAPTEQRTEVHRIRGMAMCGILFAPLLVGVLFVATAVISMFISGWMPSRWFSGNAADWLLGGGVQGDAVNFIRFMVGGVLAAGSWYGILWGFYGSGRRS